MALGAEGSFHGGIIGVISTGFPTDGTLIWIALKVSRWRRSYIPQHQQRPDRPLRCRRGFGACTGALWRNSALDGAYPRRNAYLCSTPWLPSRNSKAVYQT
ncbi:hypothetical protein M404DRAFT_647501 [Pisolithus tinctorius Marx 270]|uniref:Uncharacterized protein n=1 Tax=Pisolithus tinctorius Marx 270 TaxID=870435 RepID=A0A0C3P5S7_PISTI|nr:hypothetical protein M404DRAFT_647501 [Pisolithus tinctorius Marx 270]